MIKLNIVNDRIRHVPFNENEPFVEVDEETFQKIIEGKIKAKNGELIDNSAMVKKQKEALDLKKLLEETDYKSIQHSEGVLSDEEFAPIKAQREAWREEIRKLQKEVGDGK